ncbi:hypothetical protein QBC43DRAFT_322063 [Cladorrhinum sp. PSN259]|nr:hypothetical protein QBC43DRAFT_322063 [Cladorrhinum sp. PSN259]
MPFVPGWELERVLNSQTAARLNSPTGGGLLQDEDFEDADMGERAIWDAQDEYEGLNHEEEKMELDLPVLSKPHQSQEDLSPPPSLANLGAPPKPDKLPSLRPPPRPSSQLMVVLDSSPRRTPFATVTDDLSEDPLGMNTSDLLPKSHAKRVQISPPKAPVVVPAKLPTITPQPRKRGRPVGWRPGSGPYSKLTGGSPAPRPKPPKKPISERKKPGRPPGKLGKPPAPIGRQVYLAQNPKFLVFKCEWQGCQAELHNAETLRKHILFVHGRPPSPNSETYSAPSRPNSSSSALCVDKPSPVMICKWAKCRSASTTPPITFDISSFPDHAEQTHILPILWQLGDGPQNTSCSSVPAAPLTGNKLPLYLFDESNTTQVTPDVRDQQTENDEDRKRRQMQINKILIQRDKNAPPEQEYTEEEQRNIAKFLDEKKKRQKMFRDYAERQVIAESLKDAAAVRTKNIKVEKGGGGVHGFKV